MSKFLRIALSIAAVLLAVSSCKKNPERLHLALVTVEPIDGGINIQLNDTTSLTPVGMNPAAFNGKTMRALINYIKDNSEGARENDIKVVAIDTIRTKSTEPNLGEGNDKAYGIDPIEIVEDWATIGEDGYLTLRIRTFRDDPFIVHYIHLVDKGEKDGKYCYELRHDAGADFPAYQSDGLIAFDLNHLAPEDRSPVILRLNWEGYAGPKAADFKLTFRRK